MTKNESASEARDPGGIIPLRWAASSRNPGRNHPVIPGRLRRNPHPHADSSPQKATDAAETLPSSTKDAIAKAMSFAENNVNAAFDLAQKLVRTKDVNEILALQSEFAKSQMAAMQAQVKELGAVAKDAIASATRK